MSRLASLALVFLCLVSLSAITGATSPATISRAIAKRKYTTAHSLGDSYNFDPRDGWQSFNATTLQYKERRDPTSKSETGLKGVIDASLKAIGVVQSVIVTWYTGKDLLNPSCWANGKWHPTDESFVCATTLEGWTDKPQCFKFLELCSHANKCVFVRVVDTCAGCAAGSRHVDLTKAAFAKMGSLDEGVLEIHMRSATDPNEWFEDLWGPKV